MIDIFEMQRYSDNAVKSHLLYVGIETQLPDSFEIAIFENGKNVTETRLFSEKARKMMVEALKTEILYDERQMVLIASGKQPEEIKPTPTAEQEVPF